MKTILKLTLVVCLFSTFAFADGDMGNGNRTCTGNCFVTMPDEKTGDKENTGDGIVETTIEQVTDYFDTVLEALSF